LSTKEALISLHNTKLLNFTNAAYFEMNGLSPIITPAAPISIYKAAEVTRKKAIKKFNDDSFKIVIAKLFIIILGDTVKQILRYVKKKNQERNI
jgi:hypothetical protein